MKSYELTEKQKKAFINLKKAFTRCCKEGLYIWDNYGDISAVNGEIVAEVCTDSRWSEKIDFLDVEEFTPKCWGGSNTDDTLYIVRKK